MSGFKLGLIQTGLVKYGLKVQNFKGDGDSESFRREPSYYVYMLALSYPNLLFVCSQLSGDCDCISYVF